MGSTSHQPNQFGHALLNVNSQGCRGLICGHVCNSASQSSVGTTRIHLICCAGKKHWHLMPNRHAQPFVLIAGRATTSGDHKNPLILTQDSLSVVKTKWILGKTLQLRPVLCKQNMHLFVDWFGVSLKCHWGWYQPDRINSVQLGPLFVQSTIVKNTKKTESRTKPDNGMQKMFYKV